MVTEKEGDSIRVHNGTLLDFNETYLILVDTLNNISYVSLKNISEFRELIR